MDSMTSTREARIPNMVVNLPHINVTYEFDQSVLREDWTKATGEYGTNIISVDAVVDISCEEHNGENGNAPAGFHFQERKNFANNTTLEELPAILKEVRTWLLEKRKEYAITITREQPSYIV